MQVQNEFQHRSFNATTINFILEGISNETYSTI
jgi:hypothetical protein